jgi:outer membrane autotransporter protein
LDSPTTLEIKQGTLEIDNDFEFAATSSFSTVTNPDGSCGQLNIGGAGGLDGTLAVKREEGLFREQVTYDIITANTLSGTFSEVLLPEPTLLLGFSMQQMPDRVQIAVTRRSFISVASTRGERSVGQYLDSISPHATGKLAHVLGTFQTLPSNEFGTAFASLSPDSYNATTTTTFDVTSQYNHTLLKRMHSLRSHIESSDPSLTYSQTKQHATWADGFGHWANQDSQNGFAGYDYHLAGAAVGADRLLDEGLLAGLSYGQSSADIDMDNDRGEGDIESYFGSLYGSYFTDAMYVDTTLSYGRQCYQNVRSVEIGELVGAAHSEHDGDVYSAYVETGWNLSLGKWTLQPFAALRYTLVEEESYAESGAEGINLRVEERTTDALVSDLGLRLACPFQRGDWLCVPEATVAWDHDFDLDDRRVTAAFDGSPATTFVTDGRDVDDDGVILGAGLTLIGKSNVSLSVNYSGELRSHYEAHALTGGIRYEF